jgi:hypothetical protein
MLNDKHIMDQVNQKIKVFGKGHYVNTDPQNDNYDFYDLLAENLLV